MATPCTDRFRLLKGTTGSRWLPYAWNWRSTARRAGADRCAGSARGRDIGEWLIRVALSELAEQLDADDFARVHRSVIVNMNAVAGTRRDLAGKLYVRLRDCARELPVARQYVHLFRQM